MKWYRDLTEVKKGLKGKRLFYDGFYLFDIMAVTHIPYVEEIVLSGKDHPKYGGHTGKVIVSRTQAEALADGREIIEDERGKRVSVGDHIQVLTTKVQV